MRVPSFLPKIVIAVAVLAALWTGLPRLAHLAEHRPPQAAAASTNTGAAPLANTTPVASPVPASATADKLHRKPPAINPATLPADTVWTFKDGNNESTYRIALNELYVPSGPTKARLHTLPPQANLASLLAAAKEIGRQTGVQPQLILYPLDGTERLILSPQVHLMADDQAAVTAAAASLGLTGLRTPSYAPGHVIADVTGDPAQPLRVATALAGNPHVTFATPLFAVQRAALAVAPVNDPLFSEEWQLLNTGQQGGTAGVDVNVTPVWASHKGSGINIGIVDDSLQLTHPDLAPNVAASGHHDWNGDDSDPSPDLADDNFHGTAVAGLAAARGDNGIGVAGVAPLATLYGLRLIAAPITDEQEASAMAWKNDVIQIKNNSWGPRRSYATQLVKAGSLWQSAVANGTATGRKGRGTIYLFASGNNKEAVVTPEGDYIPPLQGSKNGFGSDMHVISVGAIDDSGSPASFSEGGAHLVVSAPGDASFGTVTTDLIDDFGYNDGFSFDDLTDADYTQNFNGTSAACPLASGVVALMLETNPNLGWRDVKEILLRSSTQLQPNDPDWVTRDGGHPELPRIKHHSFYGGGLINAQAATALAATWKHLGQEKTVTAYSSTAKTIADRGSVVQIPLDLSNQADLRVEHVEITVNIRHSYRGDLEIKLTSPSGTVSSLVHSDGDGADNYTGWTFTSVRHWGETSQGIWTLSIQDVVGGDSGQFTSATLTVHGAYAHPPTITLQPEGTTVAQGAAVTLTTAALEPNISYQWSRDGLPIRGATNASLNLPAITLAQAGTYTCLLTNALGASIETDFAPVIVYNAAPQARTVALGTTFSTGVLAAGPIDSFQWLFNASPLTDSTHIVGAETGALTVLPLGFTDAGVYTLQAMVGGHALPTGDITLTVNPPPDVTVPTSFNTRIGGGVALPLVVNDGGHYFYRYYGLPPGLTYDTATGAISGRTTATGASIVVLTVDNAFGQTTTCTFILMVEPIPVILTGTFTGYVERNAGLGQNLGGAITFTTTGKGQLTGTLVLGATSYPFKGQLNGIPGADATVSISIPRAGLSPLQLQLTLPINGDAVTGTLNSSVAVTAWRSPWSNTAPATRFAGAYTFALEAPVGSGWPAGYSTGTVSIATTGVANWTLQPADGSPALKGTSIVAADGSMPLYAPIKSPLGSFVGRLTLPDNTAPNSPITGTVSWLRGSTTSADLANAAGFGPVTLTPHGGRYAAPASGSLLLALPATPATPANASLDFDGDDVNLGVQKTALMPFIFTLASGNKVVLPLPNPTALKLTLNPGTGQFNGSFTVTDPNPLSPSTNVKRAGKFSGVLLPQESVGAGFFVLPALPGSGTGTRSGSVLLEAP